VQVESKHGRSITPEYLADMQYADATIKEVLRLAVIINTVPKRALTTFELCGYTIPEVRGPDPLQNVCFFNVEVLYKVLSTLHPVLGQAIMAVIAASVSRNWSE